MSTNLYGKTYSTINNGVIIKTPACNPSITFADTNYKGSTCSNGFKKISWYSNKEKDNDGSIQNFTTVQTYDCNDIVVSPINKIESKEIVGTKLQDIDDFNIDCGNHPITYINLSRQSNNKSILQYSCGNTSTNVAEYNNYITLTSDEDRGYGCSNEDGTDPYVDNSSIQSIDCKDNGVLTQIKHNMFNGSPKISYTCKQPIAPTSTAGALTQREIFNTAYPNYIQELNIQTDSFNNPRNFWTNHKYTSVIPASSTQHLTDTTIDDDFFSVSCGKYGISGMTNKNNNKIQYGCGTDSMYGLYVQEYEVNRDPFLQKYYNSGVLFDKVKCPNGEILSSFNRTITKNGPKVQWVCGKLFSK